MSYGIVFLVAALVGIYLHWRLVVKFPWVAIRTSNGKPETEEATSGVMILWFWGWWKDYIAFDTTAVSFEFNFEHITTSGDDVESKCTFKGRYRPNQLRGRTFYGVGQHQGVSAALENMIGTSLKELAGRPGMIPETWEQLRESKAKVNDLLITRIIGDDFDDPDVNPQTVKDIRAGKGTVSIDSLGIILEQGCLTEVIGPEKALAASQSKAAEQQESQKMVRQQNTLNDMALESMKRAKAAGITITYDEAMQEARHTRDRTDSEASASGGGGSGKGSGNLPPAVGTFLGVLGKGLEAKLSAPPAPPTPMLTPEFQQDLGKVLIGMVEVVKGYYVPASMAAPVTPPPAAPPKLPLVERLKALNQIKKGGA